jgi:hypothetical protein
MKNTNRQVKRVAGAILALVLAAPIVASAQTLDGTWVAYPTVGGLACTMQTVMNSGNYSELLQCGPYMTLQSGTYTLSGNLLVRNVIDWAPKTGVQVDGRPLGYDYSCPAGSYRTPDGHCPGWYCGPGHNYPCGPGQHTSDYSKPPGGSFQVTFASPNSMTWYDVNFHGTVTFQRVR